MNFDEVLGVSIEASDNLGPGIQAATSQLTSFGQTGAQIAAQQVASAANMRDSFVSVQGALAALERQYESTGTVGVSSLTRLQVAMAAVGDQAAAMSIAEERVFTAGAAGFAEMTAQAKAFAAAQAEVAASVAGESGFAAAAGSIGTMVAAMVGLSVGIKMFRDIVDVTKEVNLSQIELRNAVNATGLAYADVWAHAENQISSLSSKTQFFSADVRASMARLIEITGDYNLAVSMMPSILDAAAASHRGLEATTVAVGKALEGNAGALNRVGIVVDAETKAIMKQGDATQNAAIIMDLFNKQFGSFAQENMDSYAAKTEHLKNTVKDAAATFGTDFVTGLGMGVSALENFINKATGHDMANALEALATMNPAAIGAILSHPGSYWAGSATADSHGSSGTWGQTPQEAAATHDAAEKAKQDIADKIQADKDEAAAIAEKTRLENLYWTTLNGLGGAVADASTKEKALRDALQMSADGYDVNMKKIRELAASIQDFTALAAAPTSSLVGFLTGVPTVDQNVNTQLDTFIGKFDQGKFEAMMADVNSKVNDEAIADYLKKMDKNAIALGKSFATSIEKPMQSVFEDLASSGGKNLGQVFAKYAKEGLVDLANMVSKGLASVLGGNQVPVFNSETQSWMVGDQNFGAGPTGQANAQAAANGQNGSTDALIAGVLKGIGGLASLASAASVPGVSPVQTTIIGASTGLAIGGAVGGAVAGAEAGSVYPIVGTIIGAIVGALVGILGPSKGSSYLYGVPDVTPLGGATFGNTAVNMDTNEQAKLLANIQTQYDTFISGYNKILMTLNANPVAPFNVQPKVGQFQNGADLGTAASAGFMTELQNWIDSGMPHEIAAKFMVPLESAFEQYGYTAKSFQTLWDTLSKIDPSKMLANLQTIANALVSFQTDTNLFNRPTGFGGPTYGQGFFSGASGVGIAMGQNLNGADQIAHDDLQIEQLANALGSLTGQDKIDAFQQLSQMTDQRYQKEIAFINQISTTIDSITKSIQAQKVGFQLANITNPDGTPNVAGQETFLKNQLNQTYNSMASMTDPTQIQAASSAILQMIAQMVSLGTQGASPQTAAAWRQWGINADNQLNQTTTQQLNTLGNTLDPINAAFNAVFQPAYTAFVAGMTGSTNSVTNFNNNLDDTGNHLHNFKIAADDAAAALASISGNSHTNSTASRRIAALS